MRKKWFCNKTVIITGASSGFGLILAKRLVREFGCKVIGIARRENLLKKLSDELGENFTYRAFDVSVEQNWIDFYNHLNENAVNIDILINNAGILPKFATFDKCDGEQADRVLKVNFFASVYSVKYILPLIKKSKTPAVINVSSSACLASVIGTSLYSASKSALKSFTEVLAVENKGIYVALACPGFAKTEIFRSQSATEKDSKLFNLVCSNPEKIVNKMIKLMGRKKRRMVIGFDAKLMGFFGRVMPLTTNKLIARVLKRANLTLFEEVFKK